jgi:hypothetical protein
VIRPADWDNLPLDLTEYGGLHKRSCRNSVEHSVPWLCGTDACYEFVGARPLGRLSRQAIGRPC